MEKKDMIFLSLVVGELDKLGFDLSNYISKTVQDKIEYLSDHTHPELGTDEGLREELINILDRYIALLSD